MSIESFVAITLATLVLVATPGPVVIATIARSALGGFRASLAFLGGVLAADLIYAGLAVSGLTYIAATYGQVFLVIKYLGAAYLVYLGITMIRDGMARNEEGGSATPSVTAASSESILAGWMSGLLVTLGNPKLILFYVSFLPTFVDLTQLSTAGAVFTAAWVAFLFFAGNLVWAASSARLGQLMRSAPAMRRLKLGSGAVMSGAGVMVAVRGD